MPIHRQSRAPSSQTPYLRTVPAGQTSLWCTHRPSNTNFELSLKKLSSTREEKANLSAVRFRSLRRETTCSAWCEALTSDAWHQSGPHSHVNTPKKSRVITVMCNYTLNTYWIIHDHNLGFIFKYCIFLALVFSCNGLAWAQSFTVSTHYGLILMLLIGSSVKFGIATSPNSSRQRKVNPFTVHCQFVD